MGGDLGGTPFAFLVQLGDQNRVQVLAVLPRGARLHRDSGIAQPRADHALRGVLPTGDLLQRAALVDIPAVRPAGPAGEAYRPGDEHRVPCVVSSPARREHRNGNRSQRRQAVSSRTDRSTWRRNRGTVRRRSACSFSWWHLSTPAWSALI